MTSFVELFKANLRDVYRNGAGLFWAIILPLVLYVAISLLPIQKLVSIEVAYSSYLLPGIIALVIMQSGIYSLAYWLVELRARGVLTRFLVTPIKKSELVLSLISARVLVMITQAALLTAAGITIFDSPLRGNLFYALAFIMFGGFVFLLIGLLISTFGDSYEATAPLTTATGLPLTFLSSVFYPLETLPQVLQTIAKFLPITYLADGLRKVYLETPKFTDVSMDLLMLAAWTTVLLALVIWRFKLRQE